MSEINWRYSKGTVSETMISELERYFNIVFPSDYKEIIRQYNGARPKPNLVQMSSGKERYIRSFLAIGRQHPDNMIAVNKRLPLPEGVIAFANDDFGNYFCFDFRDQINILVVFWNHESGNLEKVEKLLS
ncbi:SMI1/KNR4 family protein [Alkalihalobacterium alkalinitrilicum]|uniref:SMI1/KNR4 family protein n=1 Tax=Alkalihalobacterium alkalinitrilicum TaxID=427920 RepID=UPI000994FA44|nr:SMI1/KNR4 family protein [Alkalihalobacterium alkalinitrilicum]